LGNAVKFTQSGEVPLAVVDARQDGRHLVVHISVTDTGIGIPPEWRTSIFDTFV
jgi:two-component system, NarL family, sensor histidine kinase BarA